MSKTPCLFDIETFIRLHELGAKAHAGQAILAAAVLDQELRKALLTKMRPLSKKGTAHF